MNYLVIVFTLISLSLSAQEKVRTELEDGNYQLAASDGFTEIFNSKDQLVSSGQWMNNAKFGVWKEYDPKDSKKVMSDQLYVDGKATGPYHKYRTSDQSMYESGNRIDGKIIGVVTGFFASGMVSSTTHYVDGQKNGSYEDYHDNKRTRQKGDYKDDVPVGEWRMFYYDGSLERKLNYSNGQLVGELTEYYGNGQVKSTTTFKDGLSDGTFLSYHENGDSSVIGNMEAGKKVGEWKSFYIDGTLMKIEPFTNGFLQGAAYSFNADGSKSSVIRYENGKKNGAITHYHPNGQLKLEGTMLADHQDGKFENYHENGQLYQTRFWEEGKLMNVKGCYDQHANELEIGTLKDGNGILFIYQADGTLIQTVDFTDGVGKAIDP